MFGSFLFRSFYIPEYRPNFTQNSPPLLRFQEVPEYGGNARIFWREYACFGGNVCAFWRERLIQNKNGKNDRGRQPQRNLTPFAFIVTACGLYIHRKSPPCKNTMFHYNPVNSWSSEKFSLELSPPLCQTRNFWSLPWVAKDGTSEAGTKITPHPHKDTVNIRVLLNLTHFQSEQRIFPKCERRTFFPNSKWTKNFPPVTILLGNG